MVVLCLAVTSCQKLDDPGLSVGQLQFDKIDLSDAIPLEYGKLVGVTPGDSPHMAVLWFVKPDETIMVLRVNLSQGQFYRDTLSISRK
jgi:hypothetical protein